MRKYYSIILVIIFSGYLSGQEKERTKPYEVGNRVKISIDFFDELNTARPVSIPNGAHTLLFRYNPEEDDKERLEKVDKIIDKVIKNYKVKELKFWCYSLDHGSDFDKWVEALKKKKPFKPKVGYPVDYLNTKNDRLLEGKLKKTFEKLVLVSPEGKVLLSSASIGNFIVPEVTEKPPVPTTLISARLIGDKDGSKKPLKNTMVFLYNEPDEDTIAKTQTDMFGDFVIPLPDDEKSTYQLRTNADPAVVGKVAIVNVNGVQVNEMEETQGGFKYRLLKADITKLKDVEEKEDITLSYKLFLKSGQNNLKVVRYIIYDLAKYDLTKEATDIVDQVVLILKENPKVKLEITSHTDAQGDDHTNLSLSEKRSHAVVDYIVSKGIEKKRLKGIGKGEKEIRNRCFNGVECSDKEHAYNRRTEFNFIKGK